MAAPMRINFCHFCKTYLHSFKFNRILTTQIENRTELCTAGRRYVRCHRPYLLTIQQTVGLQHATYSSDKGASDVGSSSDSDSGSETSDSDSDIELATDVVDAVKDVASSLPGDQAQVQSDLLRQLRYHAALTEQQKQQSASQEPPASFSNLFAGMKIDTAEGQPLKPTVLPMPHPSLAKLHPHLARVVVERSLNSLTQFPENYTVTGRTDDRRDERYAVRQDRVPRQGPSQKQHGSVIDQVIQGSDDFIGGMTRRDQHFRPMGHTDDHHMERFPERQDRAPRQFPSQKQRGSVIDQVIQGGEKFAGRMTDRDQQERGPSDGQPMEHYPERQDETERYTPAQQRMTVPGSVIGKVMHDRSLHGETERYAPAQQQMTVPGSVIGKVMHDRKYDTDVLFSAEPLNIFTDMTEEDVKQDSSITEANLWDTVEHEELDRYVFPPPTNAFEEMIQWTKEGKLWRFPIDNDQGWKEEENVGFHQHVFLENLITDFPSSGPIRHFMELVITGLSKNPFITVTQKHEHVQWFRDYFKEKETVIQEALEQESSS